MQGPGEPDGTAPPGLERLEAPLAEAAHDTGASAGFMYLLVADESALRLTLTLGIAQQILSPWARVRLDTVLPVADALRERRLVWLSNQEELARRYPKTALMLPYPFALGTAPISVDGTGWGSITLVWPGTHPARMPERKRAALCAAGERLGRLMRQAADAGRPVVPEAEPRALPPVRMRFPAPAEALAAVDFAERLPGGSCTLDVEGRITFVTESAAELVGAGIGDLLGATPQEALPWLDDPAVEDVYRASVLTREPKSFTVLRPPDRWLAFHLYPGASGVSVRISASPGPRSTDAPDLLHPAPPAPRGRATALYHLMHLAATLTEAVGVQDVIDQVTDQIVPAFRARALALLRVEEGRLRMIGSYGYSRDFVKRYGSPTLDSDSPSARVLAAGVPRFFENRTDLRRVHPRVHLDKGTAAWAFLPLIASGRTVGSMVLAFGRPHRFAAEERSALTALAGLIAQALDRAAVYDTKHDLVRGLQAGLLPRSLPPVPGLEVAARYLPASRGIDLGGDFYDLIRLAPACAAVTIGDVQGHSVNAVPLMGQVRTGVHATAGAPPGEVLARTNRLLTDLDSGLFTSCLYAQLDLVPRRALLATAGHPPPLLARPDGHCDVVAVPPGLLLGIEPDADYPTVEIPLPPGALLLMYTDGLVERPGTDIGDNVADLAAQLVHARHLPVDDVADALVRHATATSRNDDIALVLIRTPAGGPGRG